MSWEQEQKRNREEVTNRSRQWSTVHDSDDEEVKPTEHQPETGVKEQSDRKRSRSPENSDSSSSGSSSDDGSESDEEESRKKAKKEKKQHKKSSKKHKKVAKHISLDYSPYCVTHTYFSPY